MLAPQHAIVGAHRRALEFTAFGDLEIGAAEHDGAGPLRAGAQPDAAQFRLPHTDAAGTQPVERAARADTDAAHGESGDVAAGTDADAADQNARGIAAGADADAADANAGE